MVRHGTQTAGWRSVAAAGFDHHVLVALEDDVRVVVEVEYHDGREARGGAAGLGRLRGVHQVHQGLDDGMVGRVAVQRE